MFAGFDYGSSNCAIGIKQPQGFGLVPLYQQQPYIPSTLYAYAREFVSENVALNITDEALRQQYQQSRSGALTRARQLGRELDIRQDEHSVFVGQEAIEQYLDLPEEGIYIKSPKSFLGASGLRQEFVDFFEDVVTAMMQFVKQQAEAHLQQSITHTVIGRPVNFQGLDAEASNRQAIQILSTAAERAGFKAVEFLYEPIAAGFDYETRLTKDQTVLVVDIGGGTSDCAMVRMGPAHREKSDRREDFLSHTGERIGGNDLDIHLTYHQLMPLFGLHSLQKNGMPMPSQPYWQASAINDLGAQTAFTHQQMGLSLASLKRDNEAPQRIERFIRLREDHQQHHLVRSSELCKIALSEQMSTDVDLDYIEAQLHRTIDRQQFSDAISQPLATIIALMNEAIKQAGTQPDCIYITGGSAQSPIIRDAIKQHVGDIDVIDGDHFGSVATGLTVWAERCFR